MTDLLVPVFTAVITLELFTGVMAVGMARSAPGSPRVAVTRLATRPVAPLHTSGNQIVNADGQPLLLRGVNSGWLATNALVWPGTPLGDDSIAAMRSWGANVVRVALGQQFWNADECQHNPSYRATVDQVVQSITSRGMVALLALHSNTRARCMPSGQQRMADSPGSLEFWRSVAARYKDNPLVAFDLYNEPHDISWDQWRNGGLLVDAGVAWRAAGMQELYDAVRSTGAQNLVIVSGPDWANTAPPTTYLIRGDNIVYAAHDYAPNPTGPGGTLPQWDQFVARYPVVVAEFGSSNPDSPAYNQAIINWAQSERVGWMAFDWGVGQAGTGARFGLLSQMRPTYAPDGAGQPVRQALPHG